MSGQHYLLANLGGCDNRYISPDPERSGGQIFFQEAYRNFKLESLIMEAFIFPTAPTLLALLAGIAFLYRFWPHNLTSTPKLSNPKTSDTLSSIPDVAKEENCGVSKESDFPAGWWVSKDVAGFPIFLILGKDGKVRAFHNVCRHRAYTVTKKECGSSAVLGCRYHGWSYNTYGELTKAPHFDEIPGFDRSQNSLFAIHAVTNGAGFVFVNLDASPRISSVDTGLLDAFASNNKLDSQPLWVAGQTIKADFNWKMACGLIYCLFYSVWCLTS
ncbi:unnamed protein product [Aspergillus oryzae var. brunneus]|uniref:Unnamed protein product n=2 Tax=Aspergillus oryzae TaxID=5062 RepID=A0AAN4YS61_ASPOZ|nr:unnamed protein product [Aspergillus oryzae]GMG49147.1 unnamed protein product [Aspergillus oryzae var. brunneus]